MAWAAPAAVILALSILLLHQLRKSSDFRYNGIVPQILDSFLEELVLLLRIRSFRWLERHWLLHLKLWSMSLPECHSEGKAWLQLKPNRQKILALLIPSPPFWTGSEACSHWSLDKLTLRTDESPCLNVWSNMASRGLPLHKVVCKIYSSLGIANALCRRPSASCASNKETIW